MGKPLSITQVAESLGVSERTVYRLMEQEKLHPWKSGKAWQFDQSDVEDYIKGLRQEAAELLKKKREAKEQAKGIAESKGEKDGESEKGAA